MKWNKRGNRIIYICLVIILAGTLMLMQRSSRLAGQVDSLKLQHKTDLMVQVDLQKQLDNANDNIVEIASHVPGAQIEIVPHDAITVPQTTTTMKATSTTIRSTTSTAKAPT